MTTTRVELERLLRFVYLSPVGTVHASRDGTIELANPRATALLMMLSNDGNLGNLFALLEPYATGLTDLAMGFTEDTGIIVERWEVSVSKHRLVLALSLVAIDRESCVAVIVDVTENVEQQRRIERQEQRLSDVLEAAQELAIFTLDADGRIDEWSPSLARFTDAEPEHVVGSSFETLFDPASLVDTASLLASALRSGGTKFEGPIRSSTGASRSAEARVSPLLDSDGTTMGFGVVLHDTTARRANEERLLKLATTDPLTGARNRRAFLDAAELELRRSVRYGRELSVLLLDVDHFKTLNDRHGHELGDRVLVRLVETCQRTVRAMDVVGRWGGEEFVIVAPETGLSNAGVLAERLRASLSSLALDTPEGVVRITVSIGVATRSTDPDETIAKMIARADVALYAAKSAGRDRVVLG